MTDVFRLLAAVGFCISALVALPSWFAGLYYLVRTANANPHGSSNWRPKPGILGYLCWDPFRLILDAPQLTEQGRIYRRRLIIAELLFIVPIAALHI